jgi:hypothetical protein
MQSLDPFIGSIFQCEVLQVSKNTEFIRLYDQDLNQPLIKKLVEECDGIVQIESANIEAMDTLNNNVTQEAIDSSNEKRVQEIENVSNHSQQSLITTYLKSLLGIKKGIYITSAVSTKSIYCQFVDKFNEIDLLVNKMTEFYSQCFDSKEHEFIPSKAKKDMLIAARFTLDDKWYRASIESIKDNKLDVFYIDFGNKETVDFKSCKELLPEYRDISPYAIHCSPINPDLSYNFLKRCESDGKEIECKFIEIENNTLKVELYIDGKLISNVKTPIKLNQKAVAQNDEQKTFARNYEQKSFNRNNERKIFDRNKEQKTFDRNQEQKTFDGNKEQKTFERNKEQTTFDRNKERTTFDRNNERKTFGPNDNLKKNDFKNNYEMKVECWDIETKKVANNESVASTSQQMTTVSQEITNSSQQITTTQQSATYLSNLLGNKKCVYITFVNTTKSIYCQIAEKYDEIQEIVDELTKYYSQTNESKDHELNQMTAKKDMIIAARFHVDNNWYRASIRSIDENELDVFYIDFGNQETIDLKNCRELLEKYKEIPPHAIHCSPINSNLNYSYLKKYEFEGKEVECDFLKLEENIFEVKLYENGKIIDHLNSASKESDQNTVEMISNIELLPEVEEIRKSESAESVHSTNNEPILHFDGVNDALKLDEIISTNEGVIQTDEQIAIDSCDIVSNDKAFPLKNSSADFDETALYEEVLKCLDDCINFIV